MLTIIAPLLLQNQSLFPFNEAHGLEKHQKREMSVRSLLYPLLTSSIVTLETVYKSKLLTGLPLRAVIWEVGRRLHSGPHRIPPDFEFFRQL